MFRDEGLIEGLIIPRCIIQEKLVLAGYREKYSQRLAGRTVKCGLSESYPIP